MSSRLSIVLIFAALLGATGTIAASMQVDKALDRTTSAGERMLRELAQAKGGQTITLPPGDYGAIVFPERVFRPAIRLLAKDARFSKLVMKNVTGVWIKGGLVTGLGGRSYGITINGSHDITVDGMTITGAHRGIVLGKSDGVTIVNNRLTGLLSDGIDIASAKNILVRDNSCRNFSPTRSSFDAQGKTTVKGDHPDCIQAWSRPGAPPTSDVIVENNDIEGEMQGIFFGNHVRNGVDDGGFDRIIIRNNRIHIDHPNGIMLGNGRDSIVTGNRISTLPGAVNIRKPSSPVRTMIRVKEGANNRICGNSSAGFPGSPPTQACR